MCVYIYIYISHVEPQRAAKAPKGNAGDTTTNNHSDNNTIDDNMIIIII